MANDSSMTDTAVAVVGSVSPATEGRSARTCRAACTLTTAEQALHRTRDVYALTRREAVMHLGRCRGCVAITSS